MNAKRTLGGGYFNCVLVSLVMGLAAGTSSIGGTYQIKTSDIKPGSFNANIQSMGIQDLFKELNIPYYMLGTFMLVMCLVMVFAVLISIFLLQPLEVGCRKFFIEARKGNYDMGLMGSAFSEHYMNVVKIMLQRWIFVFLWSLLFVIPGIVKSYEYRMIPYILAEDPGLPSKEVFRKSRTMMFGDKMNAFWFDLSFILWFLLSGITFGLAGVFFVDPYYNNSCTELYALLLTKEKTPSGSYGYTVPPIQGYYTGQASQSPYYGQAPQSPTYPPAGNGGSYSHPSSGRNDGSGTIPAEDARPFDRPYGQ